MLILSLTLALQAPDTLPAVEGRGRPTVTIPRIEATATIDGVLDEPAWGQAVRLSGFSQYEPVDGRPAEERTDVLVWYAPDAIFFGITAYDREPGSIRATRADRDNIDNDDHVIIYLDTFNDHRRAFFFAVNPLGIQQDGVRAEGSANAGRIFGGTIDINPDYFYESRGQVTAEGYVVEVRIPFKSLRYRGSGPQAWGINFLRRIQRTGYNDTWTDVRRASASFLLQAGTIDGLHDLHRGVVLEAQPFVTGVANGARDLNTGSFDRDKLDTEAGLNLRAGFTSLSLDATFNPDFSQVESDVSQVTANQRFALFFPEKRPFFLEGIELFATSNLLVYTRQIENPIAGGKVTGKVGALGIAHLSAVDQDVDGGSKEALFNITRIRRDFGSNSVVGVTYTDRSLLESSNSNRVLAGDVRYVFGKLYYLEGQLGSSWTRDASGSKSAPLWKLEYDRTGRSWGFNHQINAVGRDFVSRSGFVPRNNIVSAHTFNRISFYGAPGELVENFTTFFGPRRLYRYGHLGGDAIEGGEDVNGNLTLRGGWSVRTRVSRDFVDFDHALYAGYRVDNGIDTLDFVEPKGVEGFSFGVDVETPTYRWFNARVVLNRGRAAIFPEAAKGTGTNLTLSASVRPASGIRVEGQTTYARLTRTDGTLFNRTIIPRLKVEYQPTRAIFFRVVGEYVSQRTADLVDPKSGNQILIGGTPATGGEQNDFRIDLLASFEPTPGTVAFFGYGSSMAADQTLAFSNLQRTSDGFFVKLAYQFRN